MQNSLDRFTFGNIDKSIAYEFLLKGIGEYKLEENHMLKIIGYNWVIVKPAFYDIDKHVIDVGFYENFSWIPIEDWNKFQQLLEKPITEWTEEQKLYNIWFDNIYKHNNIYSMNTIIKEKGLKYFLDNYKLSSIGQKNKFFEFSILDI